MNTGQVKDTLDNVAESVWLRLGARASVLISGVLLSAIAWLAPSWFDQKLQINAQATQNLTGAVSTVIDKVDNLNTRYAQLSQNDAVTVNRVNNLEATVNYRSEQRDKQFDRIEQTLQTLTQHIDRLSEQRNGNPSLP